MAIPDVSPKFLKMRDVKGGRGHSPRPQQWYGSRLRFLPLSRSRPSRQGFQTRRRPKPHQLFKSSQFTRDHYELLSKRERQMIYAPTDQGFLSLRMQ